MCLFVCCPNVASPSSTASGAERRTLRQIRQRILDKESRNGADKRESERDERARERDIYLRVLERDVCVCV